MNEKLAYEMLVRYLQELSDEDTPARVVWQDIHELATKMCKQLNANEGKTD